jgi:DNA-binding SARP family transcriptional activator/ATP/maltotriose-dependent transcriptional regulator MalT
VSRPAAHHVLRPRLTSQLAAGQAGAVWAGGGWGKSALASEYRDELGIAAIEARLDAGDANPDRLVGRIRRALRRAGRSDALAAVSDAVGDPREALEALTDTLATAAEPVLLVIDDVHHADADAARLIAGLVDDLPAQHRLLLLGRGAPSPLASVAPSLDSGDLAFTAAEVSELAADLTGDEAEALVRATGGWAAAVVLALARLQAADDRAAALHELIDQPSVLSHLVQGLLDTLPADQRAAVVGLAHLPLISDAVGPVRELLAAGVPLSRVRDGWWELAGGVQEFLTGLGPLEPATGRRAAAVYLDAAEVRAAITVLLRANLPEEAASTVADLGPDRLDQLDHAELGALVDALPDAAVAAHPRVLLHLARACQPAAQVQRRAEALGRALAAAGSSAVLRREIDAEYALDLARDNDFEAADALAAAILDAATDDELATRARALDVRARAAALRADDASLARAEALFEASLVLCRALGQRNWVAQTQLALADRVYFARGQHDLAVQHIDELLGDLTGRSRYRAVTLSFRASTLIDCGRFAEAEATFAEMDRLSAATGDVRAAGYLAWTAAQLASYRGQAEATRAALREAERHSGDWFAHATGAEFLAEAADLLDRVGDRALAGEYLERARARAAEAEVWFATAEAAVLARSGDPLRAREALAVAAAHPRMLPRERWRLTLLDAYAAHRAGADDAAALAGQAFAAAAALGTPTLPLARERAVAEALLPLARAAGTQLPTDAARLEVVLLGRFAVFRAGTELDLPEGRPQALVKLVAIQGGHVGVDAAIEALWPGATPDAGRKGLRNVLHRLRSAAGYVVERDGEQLRLATGAEVDLAGFEREARSALAADDPGAVARALARLGGELLPDDRYAAWAEGPRERTRLLHVELLDRLAESVEARGELDEALRLLERAIVVDPHDERRYLLAARILGAQGRRGRAVQTLARGADAMRSLGLPASPALAKLAETMRRP